MTTTPGELAIRDLLAAHEFFAGMEPAHVELLAGCGHNVVFRDGSYVAREGDAADQFFVLRSGRVAVGIHMAHRPPIIVATLGPGDVCGWSWLFPPYAWRFDVLATKEVHAVSLDGVCLRGKCDDDPALGYALMKRFAQILVARVESTRVQLADLYGSSRAG